MDIKPITKAEMEAAIRANDLEDLASLNRAKARMSDPEWLANFRRLRPDLANDPIFKDLPPEK